MNPKAQIHHVAPVHCTSHRRTHSSGNPITIASSAPLSLSDTQSPGVLLLKPNFCSRRNCSHHSNGRDGSPSSSIAAMMNRTRVQIESGPPQLTMSEKSAGSTPPNTTKASTSVSKMPVSTPNRDFSSVYATDLA